MALQPSLTQAIEESLQPVFGSHIAIEDFQPVSGGCINNGGRLQTNEGPFFVKYNDERFEGMFDTEARGLRLLKEPEAIKVPEVYCTGRTDDKQIFIVMEWIDQAPRQQDFWEKFGERLAALHQTHASQFGLDFDNYIGSLPQYNQQHADWPTFFREERIERQIAIAQKKGQLSDSLIQQIRNIYPKLPDIFPDEPASLIHGDLWGGNFMINEHGEAAIIDPAVYYGHREMELAFTQMFGGFSRSFYEAYHHHYPLEKGFGERKDLYNLYPVLVHVNLFGGPYVDDVKQIVKRYQ